MNAHSKIDHETLVNMTSKGQVLIPKALRERNGLTPNGPVRVGMNEDGQVVILPGFDLSRETPEQRRARIHAALLAMSGKYRTGQSTDDYMREIRGDFEP